MSSIEHFIFIHIFPLPRGLLAARRLTPATEGNVGASRGEVDAGVLNAFVLAVEQVRLLSPSLPTLCCGACVVAHRSPPPRRVAAVEAAESVLALFTLALEEG